MQAGYARIDITPEPGIELSGFGYFLGRVSSGVYDRLYARALCLRDSNDLFVIVACDLIGFSEEITRLTVQGISKALDMPNERILLTCTHTHSGPTTASLIGCGEPDEDYLKLLINKLINVGISAFEALYPVTHIRWVDAPWDGIGYDRLDGSDVKNSRISGLIFERGEETPVCIVNYACHPVVLGSNNTLLSADYPGAAVRKLENAGFSPLFLTGFCGEIDPLVNRENWSSGTIDDVEKYGGSLADAFLAADKYDIGVNDIFVNDISYKIKLNKVSDGDISSLLDTLDRGESRVKMEKVISIWRERVKPCNDETVIVKVIEVGRTLIIAFPGEVFSDIGRMIKSGLPDYNILLVSCAQGIMRYFPTKEDIIKKGYAGFVSAFLYERYPMLPGESEALALHLVQVLRTE